ncbi:MAG: FAD-binding oxidoreductase [Candidatus Promineifilaceae bacterium]|nr:FAD-binding oxidoreductase [Candidatus Promineifilaceae bacterium]
MPEQLLRSFGRIHSAYADVHSPDSTEALQSLLRQAHERGRRVTLRGAGLSFDSQSLNNDMVISLAKLDRILDVDVKRQQITVQAGARWGDIVERLLPLGLTPYVVVTTAQATAGGTLSGNCLSRSSPLYGKEGKHVERFELLLPDGERVTCSREENSELFHAVVGGLGYLGVVTEITYNLLEIGERTQVETVMEKYEGFAPLLDALREATHNPGDWNAVYAVAFFSGKKNKGLVLRSRYTAETELQPLAIYRPLTLLRVPVEWLIRISRINNLVWNLFYLFSLKPDTRYVNKLPGYAFFVDGNRVSAEVAEKVGIHLPTIQQTYVLPEESVLPFLEEAAARLRRSNLTPNLFDILYVQEDDFLMSSNNGLAGYAVSVAFQHLTMGKVSLLDAQLRDLTDLCHELGGRVYLVKNVHASASQLEAMYGEHMEAFRALKEQVDPDGLLRNEFFDRVFGG